MKKIKFLGLAAVLAASTAIAADNISADNKSGDISSPYSVKLEAGVAIPVSSKTKSKLTGLKHKNKTGPAVAFTFGYEINNDFHVNLELGFMQLKSGVNRTRTVNEEDREEINNVYDVGMMLTTTNINNLTGAEKVITKVNEKTKVITSMIGGNYNVYSDEQFKLSLGAQVGVATKKQTGRYKLSIPDISLNETLHLGEYRNGVFKKPKYRSFFAYGLRLAGQYNIADNANLHLAYTFKDLGKTPKIISSEKNGKSQRVHLITAGVSYNF